MLVREAAKRGLPEFCVSIDAKYQVSWHHEHAARQLEEVLEAVERGESPRVMFFWPPRHGKSDLATQKFPAWVLGKHPDWPIIVSSYSADLASTFGQGTRDIMDSPAYQNIFSTRLRPDTTAKGNWMTSANGGYTATGVGGSITGKGGKILIIDDPFKNREEADSPTIRESVWRWYTSTLYTRQEGNAAIILILTRWHIDDLAGRLLAEQERNEIAQKQEFDKWKVIRFPAIATEDEPFRAKGQPLWPEKFTLDELERIKTAIGPYDWSALYQQQPISSELQEFKQTWFKEIDEQDVPPGCARYLTVDTAYSKADSSDFCGFTDNSVDQLNNWHLRSWKVRYNPAELVEALFSLHALNRYAKIGIEKTAYTVGLKAYLDQEMRRRNIFLPIVELEHKGVNKEVRIRSLIPRYSSGSIYHIKGKCKDLEEELLLFPNGIHDDTSDSAAYQDQLAKAPNSGQATVQYGGVKPYYPNIGI